ncbi:MAG: hypothetical protein DRJ57_00190 [Thermoprotei archaeon]|nr:MAG: hypothetical protein DRJ57_00190 [Thermoprotei archaeon]
MRASLASSMEFEAFCHATENLEKVKRAILNLLPRELRRAYEARFHVELLEGHYGNPIAVVRLKVVNRSHASLALLEILRAMGAADISALDSSIHARLDRSGNLYLRVDKQMAFLGRVKLYEGDDVVRVKVKLMPKACAALKSGGVKEILK